MEKAWKDLPFSRRSVGMAALFMLLVLFQACSRPRPYPPSVPPVSPPPPDARPFPKSPLPLPEEPSLLAKITPQTPPRTAVSLRLTEEGKRLLESGEYARALSRLEKGLALDSTNAYAYFYLAKAHYHLAHYQDSLNFLDVAETRLAREPYWLAEVFALRGENLRTMGLLTRATANYSQALRLNPGNRVAIERLNTSRDRKLLRPPR